MAHNYFSNENNNYLSSTKHKTEMIECGWICIKIVEFIDAWFSFREKS